MKKFTARNNNKLRYTNQAKMTIIKYQISKSNHATLKSKVACGKINAILRMKYFATPPTLIILHTFKFPQMFVIYNGVFIIIYICVVYVGCNC